MLAALVRRRRLPGVISGAAQAGVLQLDDAQRDYLHALLGEPLSDGTGSASGADNTEEHKLPGSSYARVLLA